MAVLALPLIPCLLILVVRVDELCGACGRTLRRHRRKARDERAARRLLRAAGLCKPRPWRRRGPSPSGAAVPPQWTPPVGPVGPPIERLAADLRRLAGQRVGLATRSPVWHSAVQRAYDDRLTVACRELEIPQHLAELEGVDLEIERVRVEGLLQRAGLTVRDSEADRR